MAVEIAASPLASEETALAEYSLPSGTWTNYECLCSSLANSPYFTESDATRRYYNDPSFCTVGDIQKKQVILTLHRRLSSWIDMWRREGNQGQRSFALPEKLSSEEIDFLREGLEASELYQSSHSTRAQWALLPEQKGNAMFLEACVSNLADFTARQSILFQ